MHDGNNFLRKGGDDGAPLSTGISGMKTTGNAVTVYGSKLTEKSKCFAKYKNGCNYNTECVCI